MLTHILGNFPLTPAKSSAAGWCNSRQRATINQRSGRKLTWESPWFAVAQLSTAVRTTCVHTAIMQQKHWVLPSTSCFFQSPATEHMTVARLKHKVPLYTDTQLSVFCVPPTKHVGEGTSANLKTQREWWPDGGRQRNVQTLEQPRFLLFM